MTVDLSDVFFVANAKRLGPEQMLLLLAIGSGSSGCRYMQEGISNTKLVCMKQWLVLPWYVLFGVCGSLMSRCSVGVLYVSKKEAPQLQIMCSVMSREQ